MEGSRHAWPGYRQRFVIGLDTNVLLRAFTNDDPVQSAAARRLIGQPGGNSYFVCIVVLVEFTWSLRRTYEYPPETVREAVRRLLDASDLVLERRGLVEACLEASKCRMDLAGQLIARGNLEQGCSVTMTFDKKAAKTVSGMELLA